MSARNGLRVSDVVSDAVSDLVTNALEVDEAFETSSGASRASEAPRVPLQSFVIRWTTSPVRSFVRVPLPDWRHANRAIAVMAQVAPSHGMGVHRVWFEITWRDGERHRGRIDLVRRPLADVQVLSRHVHDGLAFQAGRLRPANVPLPDYIAAVRELGETMRRAAQLLDGYDLGLDDG